MSDGGKIAPLTSVRFIAAFMIVLAHASASGLFGFQFSERTHYVLGAGVSFFFVLSGFIITYTYGELEGRAEMFKFWGARFSRIWPTHALTFVLCMAIMPRGEWVPFGPPHLWHFLSNITLTQAMIPVPQYYFSFNAPSWSISTEAFFYLIYPLAAAAMVRRIWAPVALGAVSVAIMIAVAIVLDLPSFDANHITAATVHGWILTNPFTRFFEFACGMAAAALWPFLKERTTLSGGSLTLLEIATGLLAIVTVTVFQDVGVYLQQHGVPEAITLWVRLGAAAVAFAAFILTLSLERGAISNVLSARVMVVLGEISFAMYMLHDLGLRFLRLQGFKQNGDWLGFAIFCAVIIALSYGIWVVVERPSRRLLNQAFARLSRA